jgi:HK97 family phage major capsid protein
MDPVVELKNTCEQLGRAFQEFKTEYDKQFTEAKTASSKGTITAIVKDVLVEAKLDKIQQTMDDLSGKRDDLEKRVKLDAEHREELERKFNLLRVGGTGKSDDVEQKALGTFNMEVKALARKRGGSVPTDIDLEGFRAYKAGFNAYLRQDEKILTSEHVKAMQVGIDSDGGYLVPTDMSGRIATRVFELSPIRQIANVQAISSDALEGIEDTNEADAGWVGETASRTDTTTPQVGKYRIEAQEMYAKPKASQKLLDDSAVDIEMWLGNKVSDKMARVEGAAFITGNGVAKPRGFATYTTVATADATRTWGQLEYVPTGASGAFHTTQADPLFDLLAAFKSAHLTNGRWVTRRTVLAAIRKFKTSTTSEYIWQPGLQLGQPDRLLGYPIVNAEDMPAVAANSLSMAFGDFNVGYQIVDRLGVRTLRDPYTDKPYVVFYTIKRTGGAVVQFDAIKFIKFAAS